MRAHGLLKQNAAHEARWLLQIAEASGGIPGLPSLGGATQVDSAATAPDPLLAATATAMDRDTVAHLLAGILRRLDAERKTERATAAQ